MKAVLGDKVRIATAHLDQTERDGTVVEVHGEDGPYVVRWDDDGHTSTIVPGPDCRVVPQSGDHATSA
ncbi:Domain of unknown function DUF1918 [Beutenbergia cavernae DSM 12333]|uniref:DUF1918 domain-containing protein n=1 Tax=Beutenbergia cavernae (strain ATCC BAA-8 / DSM 12333 / CCUG 43141 / JCM 11478 / NBRC 16432 / NCIMB 13614 / HKI 0122) TaxID=471853 RepID=C5C3U7_BEUC1|nr:DUF1918 domain-containing protein [Beutenbergia cavernae]ACQ82006.1 Domain of unknown function DUF1918 [Beutenbergia cavernae DSM 12333]